MSTVVRCDRCRQDLPRGKRPVKVALIQAILPLSLSGEPLWDLCETCRQAFHGWMGHSAEDTGTGEGAVT